MTDNAYATNYTVTIKAHDIWGNTDFISDSFDFEITPNLAPVTLDIPVGYYARVPNATSWSFGASFATDPEGLTIVPTYTINGSAPVDWLTLDPSTYTFTVESPTKNEWQGLHEIVVVLDDGFFDPPMQVSFQF